MGKASETKAEQMNYLRNRLQLLNSMVEGIDDETAQPEDLTNVLDMMKNIEIKVQRFKEDWEKAR